MKKIIKCLLICFVLNSLPVLAAAQLEGNAAPDFTALSDSGSPQRLSQYRGQVVLINFWATWCNSCRQEMPPLNELYERYRSRGFTLLGVNIDDNFSSAQKMARKLGITYPILFDADKNISRAYNVGAMPMTVIVDTRGNIRSIHYGFKSGTIKKYETEIRKLLVE